ncbi:MAG: Xaa-Pro peptidase family protein [Desulfobacterota bacterium]|nr:Xaa-Pro peptidase family protein [Thermodesulfobacteriota bacterium]
MDFPAYYRDAFTPAAEIKNRLVAFQERLTEEQIDAALIHQLTDLYYLSGTAQQGFLFVPARGEAVLLIKKEFERAREESPLNRVEPLPSLAGLGDRLRECGCRIPARLGLELDVLPVGTFRFLQKVVPFEEGVDIWPALRSLREAKSEYELELLKKAGAIAADVYREVTAFIRPGLTEIEVAGWMNYLAMRRGHQNILRSRGFNSEIYNWHVVSGPWGTLPSSIDAPFNGVGLSPAFPLGAGLNPVQAGEPILIDFGTCFTGYQVDQTRMYSVGKPGAEFLEAYEALKEIEAEIIRHLRPGVPAESLYAPSLEKARELGVAEVFLGQPGRKIRYVGHGVGLESPERPFLAPGHDYPLRAGMTLALELKIVLPGGAVGFENTVAITEEGVVKLTTADETFLVL